MSFPVRRSAGDLQHRPRWGMWEPWQDFENMWSEMGRFLEQSAAPTLSGRGWTPMAEEEETDEAYVIKAEMPGIPRENIEVELKDNNELCITGELDEKTKGTMLTHRRSSFSYRSMLPGGIDSEHVEADLDNGILTVRVPKTAQSKRHHKIPITGGHHRQTDQSAS